MRWTTSLAALLLLLPAAACARGGPSAPAEEADGTARGGRTQARHGGEPAGHREGTDSLRPVPPDWRLDP